MFRAKRLLALLVIASSLSLARAADEPAWQVVTADLLKAEKPGYGGLCGILVDHATGAVYLDLSDKGIYSSADQCKTFKKQGKDVKGRTEWPGCWILDPTGKSKRQVMAVVYGAPIGVSDDQGATWTAMNGKSAHVDWFAADWSDPDLKFVLALKHEAADLLIASHDGGKTFTDVAKGLGPAWIYDNQTAIVAQAKNKDHPKPTLQKTTDGCKTFKPTATEFTAGKALPKWHEGVLYWLVDGALISTADKGDTWKKVCDLKDGRYGPIFGKDARHMFVLTGAGIVETTDGGTTWSKPIPVPPGLKGVSPLTWLEYDPKNDILYTMKMTSELYQLKRGK